MLWIEDLREELQRRHAVGDRYGEGLRRTQVMAAPDEAVARVDALVRTLFNQINQTLLGGRGSVWDAPAAWGVHIWELWWEPVRDRGPYLVVALLRDSRGTPYLKVEGRRLILGDGRLERRLQRVLRAAFLTPRVYAPREPYLAREQELPRRQETVSAGYAGDGRSPPLADVPPRRVGEATGAPIGDTLGRTRPPRRRERRNERHDS